MPRRPSFFVRLSKSVFGEYYKLVRHAVQTTLVFVVMMACFYVAKKTVPLLFPPGETLGRFLHVVDLYAALLGTIGYFIWLTLDMVLLLREFYLSKQHEMDRE